jgi:hypothetical protein
VRRFFVSVLFIISVFSVFGQNNYKNGWVVVNSGDTIKGMINYRYWNANPTSIEFRTDKTVQYAVSDLKSFGILNEDLYQRFTITRNLLSVSDEVILPDDENLTATSAEWLRILVQAKYGLAQYQTDFRSYYFTIENNVATELLYYRGIKSFNDDKYKNTPEYKKSMVRENNGFRQQLTSIAKKSNSSTPVSDNLRYTDRDLTGYILQMNGITTKKNNWPAGGFYFRGGLSYSQVRFKWTGSTGVTAPGDATNSLSPIAGVSYMILKSRSRIGFIFDLGVVMLKASGQVTPNGNLITNLSIKNTYADVSATPVFVINPYGRARCYAGAGIRILPLISGENQLTEWDLQTNKTTVINDQPYSKSSITAQFMLGLMAGRTNFTINGSPFISAYNDGKYSIKGSILSFCFSYRL